HETGIRLLLQHGASVTIQDELGNTPLHYAAFGSNMHIFSLYTAGLPVDSPHNDALKSIKNNSGETLLHWAAAGKKMDILRFLLSSGANVNAANDNGWTPLMCAVGIWGSRVVEHLQPNGNKPPATAKDRTPLHWAMFHGAAGLARVLLANGADVNAVDE
ncbi:putative ankyrin repeat protein, partial [Trichoderma atroviride IMI 206040]